MIPQRKKEIKKAIAEMEKAAAEVNRLSEWVSAWHDSNSWASVNQGAEHLREVANKLITAVSVAHALTLPELAKRNEEAQAWIRARQIERDNEPDFSIR